MKWDLEKAEQMDRPWEHWDNGYTRFRKLQWDLEHEI